MSIDLINCCVPHLLVMYCCMSDAEYNGSGKDNIIVGGGWKRDRVNILSGCRSSRRFRRMIIRMGVVERKARGRWKRDGKRLESSAEVWSWDGRPTEFWAEDARRNWRPTMMGSSAYLPRRPRDRATNPKESPSSSA